MQFAPPPPLARFGARAWSPLPPTPLRSLIIPACTALRWLDRNSRAEPADAAGAAARCDGDLAAETTAGTDGEDEGAADAEDAEDGAADTFDDTTTLFRAADEAPWRRDVELGAAAGRRRLSLAAEAAVARGMTGPDEGEDDEDEDEAQDEPAPRGLWTSMSRCLAAILICSVLMWRVDKEREREGRQTEVNILALCIYRTGISAATQV